MAFERKWEHCWFSTVLVLMSILCVLNMNESRKMCKFLFPNSNFPYFSLCYEQNERDVFVIINIFHHIFKLLFIKMNGIFFYLGHFLLFSLLLKKMNVMGFHYYELFSSHFGEKRPLYLKSWMYFHFQYVR